MSTTANQWISTVGQIMSAKLCLDRSGGSGNPVADAIISTVNSLLSGPLLSMAYDAAYRVQLGQSVPQSESDAIGNLLANLQSMIQTAINLAGDAGKKWSTCMQFLGPYIG